MPSETRTDPTKPQIIADEDGTERFVVLPIERYRRLIEALEDAEDAAAIEAARGTPRMPMAQFQRIRDGEHPMRVWRETLGRTIAELAQEAGVKPLARCPCIARRGFPALSGRGGRPQGCDSAAARGVEALDRWPGIARRAPPAGADRRIATKTPARVRNAG